MEVRILIKSQLKIVEEISKSHNGNDFQWAKTTEERNKIWKARHNGILFS